MAVFLLGSNSWTRVCSHPTHSHSPFYWYNKPGCLKDEDKGWWQPVYLEIKSLICSRYKQRSFHWTVHGLLRTGPHVKHKKRGYFNYRIKWIGDSLLIALTQLSATTRGLTRPHEQTIPYTLCPLSLLPPRHPLATQTCFITEGIPQPCTNLGMLEPKPILFLQESIYKWNHQLHPWLWSHAQVKGSNFTKSNAAAHAYENLGWGPDPQRDWIA